MCYNGESKLEEFTLFLKERGITLDKIDFKKRSTIGIGGVANAVYPRSFTELISVIDACEAQGVFYRVLGCLSNVLPPMQDEKTVYILTRGLNAITLGDAPLVHAGATATELLRQCLKHGKSGAEFLAGIPCTIGGAAFMNAGVNGRYFSEIVRSVIAYENGEIKTYSKDECEYSYKHSRFMQKGVIFAVVLDLQDTNSQTVSARIDGYLENRRRLPKGKSMGCVFKNPNGYYAGALIEGAGLKGLRQGGAVVSCEHANFIINDGGATTEDVKTLIEKVRLAVLKKYGVSLMEEIRYL